jgi:hypothetical protein
MHNQVLHLKASMSSISDRVVRVHHFSRPVPARLPELSDGPHMAYALPWIFFAGLVGLWPLL